MTDQFVTNEQAIALKKLGFEQNIYNSYVGKSDPYTFNPLKQQAIEWMLEKHHIYGWVEHYWYPLGHRWKACVKNLDGKKVQINGELHSYSEALCKCIDMLIEYVKN